MGAKFTPKLPAPQPTSSKKEAPTKENETSKVDNQNSNEATASTLSNNDETAAQVQVSNE